jgi:hypothetical protein
VLTENLGTVNTAPAIAATANHAIRYTMAKHATVDRHIVGTNGIKHMMMLYNAVYLGDSLIPTPFLMYSSYDFLGMTELGAVRFCVDHECALLWKPPNYTTYTGGTLHDIILINE